MISDQLQNQTKLQKDYCGGRKNWHMALLVMGIFTMLASGIPLLCHFVRLI